MRLERLTGKIVAILCSAALCAPLLMTGSAGGLVVIEDDAVPLAGSIVLTPSTGSEVKTSGKAAVDYSNASQGYVMVKYTGSKQKIKLLIEKGGSTYKYSLNAGGRYEVFPLTMGDGSYKIGVYENVSGDQYATALTTTVNVSISNSLLPYLYPNQYVNFSAGSSTVKKGEELASSATSQLGIVSNVYNYVVTHIAYDYAKASSVQSGYVPVVDNILSSGMGICFDYAAVMATMLRTQNIPTRLQVGYVSGGVYHAWISVYTPETGWINNIIQFDGVNWKLMDPTLASTGTDANFIGNGSNYSLMYQY